MEKNGLELFINNWGCLAHTLELVLKHSIYSNEIFMDTQKKVHKVMLLLKNKKKAFKLFA